MLSLNIVLKVVIAGINIAAVELTIIWNNITDVNNISSVGQTIPLMIGIVAVVRIVYVFFTKPRAKLIPVEMEREVFMEIAAVRSHRSEVETHSRPG
jgi:hypothetical protein